MKNNECPSACVAAVTLEAPLLSSVRNRILGHLSDQQVGRSIERAYGIEHYCGEAKSVAGSAMRFSLLTVFQVAACALLVLITALSLVPAAFRPETGLPHNFEHFAIFATAGVAFGLGFSRWRGILVPALVVFAAAIEITQSAIPSRHARLEDFIIDAVAVSISAAIAATIARRMQF